MRVLNVAEKNKVAATVSQQLSGGRCRQSNSWCVLGAGGLLAVVHLAVPPSMPARPSLCALTALQPEVVACTRPACPQPHPPTAAALPTARFTSSPSTCPDAARWAAQADARHAATLRMQSVGLRHPSDSGAWPAASLVRRPSPCWLPACRPSGLLASPPLASTAPSPHPFLPPQVDMVFTSVAGHLLELEFEPRVKGWHSCSPRELYDASVSKGVPKVGARLGAPSWPPGSRCCAQAERVPAAASGPPAVVMARRIGCC